MLTFLTRLRLRQLTLVFVVNVIVQNLALLPSYGQEFSTFFESGRMRSEDRLNFRPPPDKTIPVRERSRSWQYVVFEAGGCSFWMPPGILSQETVNLETSLGGVSFRTLASNAEDRRFVVAYAPNLNKAQLKFPGILLEAIRDEVAPAEQFNLVEEREITIDGYPGIELTLENAEEIIKLRAYLVNDKVFVLGVHAPRSAPMPQQTRGFFNAFELLDSNKAKR